MVERADLLTCQCADRPNCGAIFKVRAAAVEWRGLYCPKCGEHAERLS